MQTVQSGVMYAVGSFSAQSVSSQSGKPSSVVLGCAPIGEVYVVGLLKAKRASVPT